MIMFIGIPTYVSHFCIMFFGEYNAIHTTYANGLSFPYVTSLNEI
jgi:hypothetical protein